MPRATLDPANALPRSHVFLSFAAGDTIRTFRVRRGVMRAGVAAAALAALWLVGSSAYLACHDDLVASLMAREAAAQYAYEDRIVALRGQVEHEASLKLVGQTTLETKLKELGARAATLEAREALLAGLTSRTGPGHAVASQGGTTVQARAPLDAAPPGPSPSRPQVEGAADLPVTAGPDGRPFTIRLAAVEERLEHVDAGQYRALAGVSTAAHQRAETLRAALASAGLSPERIGERARVNKAASGQGGPFVPLDPAITHSAFGQALEGMRGELLAASALAEAVPHIPFAKPLSGALEVTSPFGARLDPFLGRAAMHTGVDLREDYGTEVRATATGRVVTAGAAGGYGTMIEIDHGGGLATRYAHLSSVAVYPGQAVEKGAIIGDVGASGRATGPHLHYETRIDGEPVDPERFLVAGTRLAAMERAE